MGYSVRTVVVLVILVVTSAAAIAGARVYVWRERGRLDRMVNKNFAEITAASELHAALVRQHQGLANLLLGTGGQGTSGSLPEAEPRFKRALETLQRSASTHRERMLLEELQRSFATYDVTRDRVVALHRAGAGEAARRLYADKLTSQYSALATACRAVVDANSMDVGGLLADIKKSADRFGLIMISSLVLTIVLGGGLLGLLFFTVVRPLRLMANEARSTLTGDEDQQASMGRDDLRVLAWSLRMLRSEAMRRQPPKTEAALSQDRHHRRLACLGEAVAKLVHDMRNRLTVIGGYAKFISERPTACDVVAESAPLIWSQVRKMERMLEEIVDFSKPALLSAEALMVNSVVEAVVRELTSDLPAGVKMALSLSTDCPAVMGDAGKMERVLSNLIRNAIDAVGTLGQITVTTRTRGAQVEISVADDGPGVAHSMRERAFAPFVTTKKKGTGLGLAICQQIAEEHGGTITLDAEVTRGAVFRVSLPVAGFGGGSRMVARDAAREGPVRSRPRTQ